MRRLVVPALCAGAIAAPIPVALAVAGTESAGDVAVERAERQPAKAELRDEARDAKRSAERRAAARHAASAPTAAVAVPPALEAIAQCESGGNPRAIGGGGLYRGKYQFSTATWAAVGGSGDPAAAPEAEQDARAASLLARDGAGHWPVCGG